VLYRVRSQHIPATCVTPMDAKRSSSLTKHVIVAAAARLATLQSPQCSPCYVVQDRKSYAH